MITNATALKLAHAYREIEEANKLLETIAEAKRQGQKEPDIRDAFSRRGHFQLGVPYNGGHRLMDVDARLAEIIIEAHIKDKHDVIAAANELARRELDDPEEKCV